MACKYTYGNQVYDSLDDLKAAVKNDLQRSADKEDVGLSAHPVTKIISGAQTGVDMAGLDAGKEIGIPTGGTAAAKFQQSVGEKQKEFKPELANIYGLKEGKVTKRFTQDGRQYDDVYYQRTLDNAQEADGTIWFGNAGSPGGKLTLGKDAQKGKPAPLVNPTSAQEIRNWLNKHNIKTLNVAGNREYTNPGIYDKAKTLLVEALKSNIVDNNNQSNTAVKPQGTINVYWGQAESSTSTKILSNLAPRKFKYKSSDGISREYGSVEHAYQTLKSGSFDQVTYDKYVRAGGYGTKITGKIANKATNLQLMKDLVVASFEQNSDSPAAKKLLQYEKFTHNTNEIIDQAFLEGLKLAQAKLLSSQQSNTTQQSSVPYYTGSITPEPNTIFVFGSNPEGRHGLGAAKVAKEQFGAKYGQGEGLQGNAYALPTKDLRITENNGFKSITPEQITANIKRLYEAARQNPSKQFKIAYNEPAGKRSLNGYTGFEMIEMFNNAGERPANIIFSKHWVDTGKLNLQQSKTEAKITDVEVEAMTDALVEMYPEIEFGIENNPNFVDREGVFNQRIENEMDRDYWRDLYRNTYTKNQQEFRLMSIPTIADKYEPDTEHVYHGTKNYKIDSEGNLILVPSENYSGKTTSISFTQIPVVAQDYMIRKRGNIIIKIDNDVLGDDYEVESAEEIAVNGNKLFIVPKGKYTIITVPRLNELREVEVGKQIDKKANKLLSTISDDLALLDTIYAAQIEAKNYSEFQEQTDNPNKIVDSLYLDERYVASAAGTQIYEQVASKVDKQWIITALSNKLIDDIENTGKTISNIEDALWDMSRYGEDYAPHTSNLFEELLNHIGLGYNAAFGVSENATKESILLQQEKQKEREEIVDKIEELVNKADEKALAVYNSEEEVAKRKERKLLRDTARAKYLSLAENQVKQEMPDDLPFQKIQKDGKSKIIGQADIQARKVLIDAAFKNKPDLVSHEFAHHYIAWFRNTPLVQQGIKMYGSEEALVQAIGEQAVVQRGKAWSWWKKFVAWLLNSANDVSDLTKENLRDILTDAFLSRQDLNKQAGTEAGVKLEKNVAVLGGETYLWNDNTGSWQPFTKSEADIEYSNDEMQKLMQEERDAKAQVKNDPVITPSWQTNTKEQLENRLLNTHKAIALNKANRYNLFASINTNETKRITDKDNLNISAKQKNKGSIVDPLTNLIAAIVMVGSKQGVGNLANVISARALLMFVNAHSNNTFKYSVGADAVKKEAIPIFLTPFGISKQDFQNLGDPNYSFGSLIDGDNRSVMFNSSEQITNEVDAVKNPVAIHLGYSQQNLNLIGYLTSLHITPEKIFTFLGERDSSGINFKSNNVTNKWALYVATNENMFHSGKTYTTEVEHEDYASGYNYTEYRKNQIELANNKLKQQFIADLLKEEANKFVRPDVSVTNYFEDIKNDEGRVVGTKLKYAEIERDGLTNQLLNNKVLKILYYWDLIEQAKQFMKSGKVIIADSHYSKSMNDALLQADSVEEQLNGKDISVISNSDLRGIIEGDQSIVSGFFSAQSKYKTYFLKYFFGHESIISRYLNDQLKLRYNKTSKEDLERLMNRAYSDLLVNILFKMQVIDPSISQGVFPKDSSGNTLTPEAMLHSKPASSNTKSTVYNIYRTLKQISGTTGKAQVLPKYSGITKSMATALLDILQFQLGVDGNRMASEDKVNKGEVVPADLVKLAEKVSNSATANNYIELFEEVKQLAPELFKEFTMISLYQAGFNNSPYNLFKAMPNTASTNDGIIDATAKATDAYSKFIKSVAKQLKQDSDLTQAELETDLHKEVVDEFLRWYDSQYGHFVAQDKNRAMFNDNTPIYRMYNSKAQKFDLYVIGARGFNETGTKIANRVAGAKNTVDFTKTVDPKYNPVAATVNDLTSLGVLGEDAKVLIDNGIEVTKLCN